MDERAFREKIRSNMKLNEQMRTVLPQHNELLDTLNNLEAMAIGQSDRIFCNSFISEAIRLLINAIFLYEDGYFDTQKNHPAKNLLIKPLKHATVCFILPIREFPR